MELKLKILSGSHAGREIAITGPQFLVGRAVECQLRPKSETVSRRHAMLQLAESKATVQDLGSRTGTWINGKAIPRDKPIELSHGDTLKIGPMDFSVLLTIGLNKKKNPKVQTVAEAAGRTAQGDPADIDVTQWLQSKPTDDEEDDLNALGETLSGSVVSAADLLQLETPSPTKEEVEGKKSTEPPPDQAASDMLKNYLRRR